MTSASKKKRGQTIGLAFVGLAVVFISISFIFLSFIVTSFTDVIVTSNDSEGNYTFAQQPRDFLTNTSSTLPKVLDASFAFFVVVSTIMLVAAVAVARANLIFFAISATSFLFMILGNAVFANLIDSIGNSSVFASTYSQLPMMQFFASNWLTFTIVTGFLSIIAYFGGKVFR